MLLQISDDNVVTAMIIIFLFESVNVEPNASGHQ